jgi:hypothetical protein
MSLNRQICERIGSVSRLCSSQQGEQGQTEEPCTHMSILRGPSDWGFLY